MEQYLDTYIGRMRPAFSGLSPAAAHEIASAFLAYRFSLWANAARECTHAMVRIPDSAPNAALKKALQILKANAEDRDNAQVTADLSVTFLDGERQFTAINLPAETIEDPGTYELDNAIILIYVVALIASEEDGEALEEHRRTIVRLLTDYKKAMGFE
jgi:hypothetical protein